MRSRLSSKPYGYPRNWPSPIAQGTREGMDPYPGETTWQTKPPSRWHSTFAHVLVDPRTPNLPKNPGHTEEDVARIKTLPMTQYLDGWRAAVRKIILLEQLGKRLCSKIYQSSHMGAWRMQDLLRWSKIKDVQKNYKYCHQL